jgi:hypothetical protein
MQGWSNRSKRMWRRATASVLIYLLVLQGMALALAGSRLASAEDSAGGITLEVCHHNGDASNAPAQTPDPIDNSCCIICVAGANFVLAAFGTTPGFEPIVFAAVRWPVAVSQLPTRSIDANFRPRGPPTA